MTNTTLDHANELLDEFGRGLNNSYHIDERVEWIISDYRRIDRELQSANDLNSKLTEQNVELASQVDALRKEKSDLDAELRVLQHRNATQGHTIRQLQHAEENLRTEMVLKDNALTALAECRKELDSLTVPAKPMVVEALDLSGVFDRLEAVEESIKQLKQNNLNIIDMQGKDANKVLALDDKVKKIASDYVTVDAHVALSRSVAALRDRLDSTVTTLEAAINKGDYFKDEVNHRLDEVESKADTSGLTGFTERLLGIERRLDDLESFYLQIGEVIKVSVSGIGDNDD